MITILYPIYNLYNQSDRLEALNISIKELDSRFNIVIADSGKQSSLSYIENSKPFYIYIVLMMINYLINLKL